MCDGVKSHESCFNDRNEWMLHNTVLICVSCEHLQTENNPYKCYLTEIMAAKYACSADKLERIKEKLV